jgi:hypothetical protein
VRDAASNHFLDLINKAIIARQLPALPHKLAVLERPVLADTVEKLLWTARAAFFREISCARVSSKPDFFRKIPKQHSRAWSNFRARAFQHYRPITDVQLFLIHT